MSTRLWDGVWASFTGSTQDMLTMLFLAYQADETGVAETTVEAIAFACGIPFSAAQESVDRLLYTLWLAREGSNRFRIAVDRLRWHGNQEAA